MNFFEQELRKLAGQSNALADPHYIGRACYGRVSDNIRAKLRFVTMGTADQYEALQVTLLNNTDGEIDRSLIWFRDLWGIRPSGNPNFRDGVYPIYGRIAEHLSGTSISPRPATSRSWPTVWTNTSNCLAKTWSRGMDRP